MALDENGQLPMSVTAIAEHLETTVAARWRAVYARQYAALDGHWMGGRCSNETRLTVIAQLLDLGLFDLHPGLNVNLDVDEDGRPIALLVSNPRSSTEIAVSLTPRAFRIDGTVTPLEIASCGRRAVEACAMAVARIVAAPATPDRRKGRRS
ncbi:MAG: hypothetical protein KJ676_14605 [Alphaproteobacteria bacterium]|nr:hypothetical protein [Alphaproteobacteria bacterium]MBU1526914.1 hypothetical protein [Alphaproteobacteria bacterium]MBU2352504.1 hypothetical protein [Alphaproteobacteria bacterium]MBU2382006.1 hypothetical protein [Alphaproteobacteria bacterium]